MSDSPVVLDASAVFAAFNGEPGAARVGAALDGALISAVTLAEVAAKVVEWGVDLDRCLADLEVAGVRSVPFTTADAAVSGRLRGPTRSLGLSLGDRCCLALALRTPGAIVLTTDRAWAGLDLPVTIEVLR